jgi:hypothetical protein
VGTSYSELKNPRGREDEPLLMSDPKRRNELLILLIFAFFISSTMSSEVNTCFVRFLA